MKHHQAEGATSINVFGGLVVLLGTSESGLAHSVFLLIPLVA